MTREELEKLRKKLIFRSWHRGTREIDLLLGKFANSHINEFDKNMLLQYDGLLQNNDLDIYNWITGKTQPPANAKCDVLQQLVNFYK